MLSFDNMKKMYSNVGTIGQQLKVMSDDIMQETFDNDIQTRQCYLYDYYHDDQMGKEYGYNPALSKTKIPVKLKFIIKSYRSIAKDEPDYHIMFEPDVWNSMSCKPDWFIKDYERFGIEFPVGLYVDIPDDRGVYHRWLVMYSEPANQFPKFGVLKCNYLFKWIETDGIYRHKRKVWGINATQNSYTSGVYTDYKFTRYEEQDKFYLPWVMSITTELEHDMRMIISMFRKKPWVYKITKVDDTAPKGIIVFTVKQDIFDPERDYVGTDPNGEDYGDMYANYKFIDDYADINKSDIPPCDNDSFDCNKLKYEQYTLILDAANDKIKIGTSKVLSAKIYDGNKVDITGECLDLECSWSFELWEKTQRWENNQLKYDWSVIDKNPVRNGLIVIDETYMVKAKENKEFKCKFKFNGDEQYLNCYAINVTCKIGSMSSNILLDIVTL